MADILPKDKNILLISLVGGAGLAGLIFLSKRNSGKKGDTGINAVPFGPAWWGGSLMQGGVNNKPPDPVKPVKPVSPIPPGGSTRDPVRDPLSPGPPPTRDTPQPPFGLDYTGGGGGTIKGSTSLAGGVWNNMQTSTAMQVG